MFKFLKKDKRIYADYAASTPLDKKVLKAMLPYLSNDLNFGNPSSVHSFGRKAKDAVQDSRKNIAQILKVQSDEIIFTSGGTESDNLAIFGSIKSSASKRPHIITSVIEHSAVLEPIRTLERKGISVTYLGVGEDGRINIEELKKAINSETVLISIAWVNGEVGTIEKIREIGNIIKKYKESQPIYFHTDASQAAQFLNIIPKDRGIDLMTLDSSKIYGPKGVGILFVRRGTPLSPIIFGGMQERGLRAGTENVPGIVGFAKSLEVVERVKSSEEKRLKSLRDLLWQKLSKSIDGASVNGFPNTLPNFLNICIPGVDAEFLSVKLDREGIAVSSASACRSISGSGSSYVIEAMRRGDDCSKSSLRFSFGRGTSIKDIKYIAKVLPKIIKK